MAQWVIPRSVGITDGNGDKAPRQGQAIRIAFSIICLSFGIVGDWVEKNVVLKVIIRHVEILQINKPFYKLEVTLVINRTD